MSAELKTCPLCRSKQIQLCSDSNNPAKDWCKCREYGCQALLSAWNTRAPSHHQDFENMRQVMVAQEEQINRLRQDLKVAGEALMSGRRTKAPAQMSDLSKITIDQLKRLVEFACIQSKHEMGHEPMAFIRYALRAQGG